MRTIYELTKKYSLMQTKKLILVVGSANTDLVVSAAHFPAPGETIMGDNFIVNNGGKGANQAVAAARLGGDVAFVCKLGTDGFGDNTYRMLESEGIDVSHVTRTSEVSSGVALITVDRNGENTIVVNSGANALLTPKDVDAAEELFEKAGIVLMQLETPVETLVEAAKLGKKHGAKVILNPAPAPKEPLPEELTGNVDLIIPNETEASQISGVEVKDVETAKQALTAIRTKGAETVLTLGGKGVAVLDGGELAMVPAYKVKAVDTTAAGDTFCGALCVAMTNGMPMLKALDFANKAASVSVTRAGAQQSMPRLEEVAK